MDFLKILKCNVFLVSFAMFCYQLNTATLNLLNPPTVLTQYERDATDDDMPLVTICPINQINYTRLTELGYINGYTNMLMGAALCNNEIYGWCTSWGAHVNLTFDELKAQVFDVDRVDYLHLYIHIIYREDFKGTLVFIPGYGLCKEFSLMKVTEQIAINYNQIKDDVRVFITNRNYRSNIMPDVASNKGKEIFLKPKTKHFINVMIQERLYCKVDEKPMSQEEFTKCVDDKIHEEFKQYNISCIPPWMSYNKQCNQTYWQFFYGKFTSHFEIKYVGRVGILKNIRIEEKCRQSCKETSYIVDEEGSNVEPYGTSAFITFNQKVFVTVRVPNYDMFHYIIDVGSSLGLWLGLSVLGLYDLIVWSVQFVNNSFIIKKIRSAVTK